MDFDSVNGFFSRHYLTILFYLGIVLFVFLNRKRFEFQLKVIALYRANWGIKLMDRIASRYGELVKLFGYISIGVGFIGMLLIVTLLLYGLYVFFTTPDSAAQVGPVLPGVHVPGLPAEFFVPLVQGLVSIFIVAVIHEFSHGVVARAHGIAVKSTGIAIIGPFFAAFVEPDEKELKKRDDVTNYSILAAGPASNIFTAVIVFLLFLLLPNPLLPTLYPDTYPDIGISFSSVSKDSPAELAGLEAGVVYDTFNGNELLSTSEFLRNFRQMNPGETITLGNSETSYLITLGSRPDGYTPYLGVTKIHDRFHGEDTMPYRVVSWIAGLVFWIGVLSFAIGTANLLPVGPIDGGKMMQQFLHKIRGENKGDRMLIKISVALLVVILLLLTPVIRETLKLLLKLLSGILGLLRGLF